MTGFANILPACACNRCLRCKGRTSKPCLCSEQATEASTLVTRHRFLAARLDRKSCISGLTCEGPAGSAVSLAFDCPVMRSRLRSQYSMPGKHLKIRAIISSVALCSHNKMDSSCVRNQSGNACFSFSSGFRGPHDLHKIRQENVLAIALAAVGSNTFVCACIQFAAVLAIIYKQQSNDAVVRLSLHD